MSAYLTRFQTSITAPIEAMNWLEKKLSGEFDKGDSDWMGAMCDFERDSDDPTKMYVWTACPEDCDDAPLVDAVLEMQEKFGLTDPWILEESFHFSSIGAEFHTGVAICFKGQYWFLNASDYVTKFLEEVMKEEVESDHLENQSPES